MPRPSALWPLASGVSSIGSRTNGGLAGGLEHELL